MLVSLVAVPLMLKKYGQADFGLWATVSSLLGFASFLDLGLGNALLNSVARAHAGRDLETIRRQLSSAFAVLAGLAVALLLAFPLAASWIDWGRVFGAERDVATRSIVAFSVPFLLTLPFSIGSRALIALGAATTDALWQCASAVLLGLALLGCTRLDAGVHAAVLASSAVPAAIRVCAFFAVRGVEPAAFPTRASVSAGAARALARPAAHFFILQCAVAAIFLSDNLVIGHVLGDLEVASYAISNRLFAIPMALQAFILLPTWPQLAQQIESGAIAKVRSTLVTLWALSVLGGLAFLGLALAFRVQIFTMWTRGRLPVPEAALVGWLGAWSVIQMVGSVNGTILSAAELLRFQIVTASITGALALGAKVVGASAAGTTGVVWGALSAYIVATLLPSVVLIGRLGWIRERVARPVEVEPGRQAR
jgi:O-antigen/teichoic acid export membrane protein